MIKKIQDFRVLDFFVFWKTKKRFKFLTAPGQNHFRPKDDSAQCASLQAKRLLLRRVFLLLRWRMPSKLVRIGNSAV